MENNKHSFLSSVVEGFLRGNLPILLILLSVVAGVIALQVTPREEEPQIVVPIADIMVSYPGGTAEEVEMLVSSRLERMLYQIDGVEYVYSASQPDMAVITVRFRVGEDREDSLIKLYNKLQQNMDRVTPGITGWVVKPVEIDDVPIVCATLHSALYSADALLRVAEELVAQLQSVPNTGNITLYGGAPREIAVYLALDKLAVYHLSPMDILHAIRRSNVQQTAGYVQHINNEVRVVAGPPLQSPGELARLVVGDDRGRPIHLSDVGVIRDGPAELSTYTRFGYGPAASGMQDTPGTDRAAVTIGIAKQKGSNAVTVSDRVQSMLLSLQEHIVPNEVDITITRDYGATADDKVNDLVNSLAMAVLTVIGLLALTMNIRAGLIVALAVPITYSLTLLLNFLMGYTINRVTLFALILALGLLVDDPIASVENIERHLKKHPDRDRKKTIVGAMSEIMPPIILSTLAIILAFTPMFAITGMMGPYMRPMAMNVPIAVTMSTIVALTITPWLCHVLLKKRGGTTEKIDIAPQGGAAPPLLGVYERLVGPFIDSRRKGVALLACTALLFVLSVGLALSGLVPLKMLPFDNKNEFQIIVDLPESATLEQTDAVVREVESFVLSIPEVVNYTSTVGTGSPMDFNGLVRKYYLRNGANVADIRVTIVHRDQRHADSHGLVLRIRDAIDDIATRTGAALKIVELPPGPPVLATLVAELYAEPGIPYHALTAAAETVKEAMRTEKGVVDIDDSVESRQTTWRFTVDRKKAARNGIAVDDIAQTFRLAVSGMSAGTLHMQGEQNERHIRLRTERVDRSMPERLLAIPVIGRAGDSVQIGELGTLHEEGNEQTIMHKNQRRVVYVMAEVAGRGPAYAVLGLQAHFRDNPLPEGITLSWTGEGEWKITLDVFRDLGIAFGIALLGIYVLLVYETTSYLLPIVIMLSIPLTMIGIMPGFWLLNVISATNVGGYDHLVFFTATAMIGMIALCGIVVRNAIVLIDFIRSSVADGMPLRKALVESGAVRARPILLTAGTTLLGTWPITLDPIFSGLAWSLIFGLLVSTVFTLVVIPTVFHMLFAGKNK